MTSSSLDNEEKNRDSSQLYEINTEDMLKRTVKYFLFFLIMLFSCRAVAEKPISWKNSATIAFLGTGLIVATDIYYPTVAITNKGEINLQ
jgi:hypothetical protein